MKRKKEAGSTIIIIISIIAVICLAICIGKMFADYMINDISEQTANISEYKDFLGEGGKYKTNFGTYNDIFPNDIPQTAVIEDFCYSYYNLADPCYLGYLVYTCEQEEFEREYERLKHIESSDNPYIYGTTAFPYELLAVYADDYYGYIYALADTASRKLIYVELQFCNGFTDIDYVKIIDEQYLPIGFEAFPKY